MAYEGCGVRFRFVDYVADNGGSINNGMGSSISERYQNWHDADGSAAGATVPLILGSATAEAGGWWQLDSVCDYSARSAPGSAGRLFR